MEMFILGHQAVYEGVQRDRFTYDHPAVYGGDQGERFNLGHQAVYEGVQFLGISVNEKGSNVVTNIVCCNAFKPPHSFLHFGHSKSP